MPFHSPAQSLKRVKPIKSKQRSVLTVIDGDVIGELIIAASAYFVGQCGTHQHIEIRKKQKPEASAETSADSILLGDGFELNLNGVKIQGLDAALLGLIARGSWNLARMDDLLSHGAYAAVRDLARGVIKECPPEIWKDESVAVLTMAEKFVQTSSLIQWDPFTFVTAFFWNRLFKSRLEDSSTFPALKKLGEDYDCQIQPIVSAFYSSGKPGEAGGCLSSVLMEVPRAIPFNEKPKIKYFAMAGRGEPALWCLSIAGLEYEYVSVEWGDDWKEKRFEHSPTGRLPLLIIGDGKGSESSANQRIFTESNAIIAHCAGIAGLLPDPNSDEYMWAWEVCRACDSPWESLYPGFVNPELREKLCTELEPEIWKKIDDMVAAYQDAQGHVISGKLTFIDFIVANVYRSFLVHAMGVFCPNLRRVAPHCHLCYQMVFQIPEVIKTRFFYDTQCLTLHTLQADADDQKTAGGLKAVNLSLKLIKSRFAEFWEVETVQKSRDDFRQFAKEKHCSKEPPLLEVKDIKSHQITTRLSGAVSILSWLAQATPRLLGVAVEDEAPRAHTILSALTALKGAADAKEELSDFDAVCKETQTREGFLVGKDFSWIDVLVACEVQALMQSQNLDIKEFAALQKVFDAVKGCCPDF